MMATINQVLPKVFYCWTLLVFFPFSCLASKSCIGPRTTGELREALWGRGFYDKYTRPSVSKALQDKNVTDILPFEAAPDVVRAQLHVLALTNLDQKRNEYQINVWFRVRWNDFRFQHLSASQGGCFADDSREGYDESVLKEIWHPDIYVENQVKVDQNVAGSVWIYPNGDVVHVQQLLVTLACNMDFSDFPYDEQRCGFKIGTWLEDAKGITMDFWENMDAVTLASQSLDQNQQPQGGSSEWNIKNAYPIVKEAGTLHGATQAESTVEIVFVLERVADYYSDFVILPAIMFVTIGWFSFFLHRSAAPARVAMSIIGFLANMNFLAAQLNTLPRLGNEVLLLRFLYLSSIFSFFSVLEYVVCNYLRRIEARIEGHRKKAEEYRENVISDREVEQPRDQGISNAESTLSGTAARKKDFKASGFEYRVDYLLLNANGQMIIRDEHVDVFSRYTYPIAYIVAACCLWLTN